MARGEDPTIWEVDDALWVELQPLLVVNKPRKKHGAKRKDDRPLFNGLIWVARSGGQWEPIPRRFGAKSTIHDRFQEWVGYGCLEQAWARLLAVYDDEVALDWQWQAADGCLVQAPLGKQGMAARRKRRVHTPPTAGSAVSSGTC